MIPVATTTIKVETATEDEPGEGRTWSTVATAVRAVIGSHAGAETVRPGGGREAVRAHLDCDPVDLGHLDRVTDETTGIVYEVSWAAQRTGLGREHTVAGLVTVEGRA